MSGTVPAVRSVAGIGSGRPVSWLSSREELLLLQEMGQVMARWQQHVMDKIIRRDWVKLEQVSKYLSAQAWHQQAALTTPFCMQFTAYIHACMLSVMRKDWSCTSRNRGRTQAWKIGIVPGKLQQPP